MSYHSQRPDQSYDADSHALNSWQDAQRGRAAYQVAPGTSYIPDFRDRSLSPAHGQHRSPSPYQAYRPPQQTQQSQWPQQPSMNHALPIPPPHATSPAPPTYRGVSPYAAHSDTSYRGYEPPSPYSPEYDYGQPQYPAASRGQLPQSPSFSSNTGLAAAAASPAYDHRAASAASLDNPHNPSSQRHSMISGYSVYPERSREGPVPFGTIDPDDIDDDGDDGWGAPRSKKAAAAAAGAGAGIGMASLAASKGARDASGNYKSVGGSAADADAEKTQWLQDEAVRRKRRKWLTIGVIGIIVIAAIVGGSIGAVITTRKINDKYSSAEDTGPELTLSSKSIKAILNNPNLHKVFPGMDYTPLNAQYPDCIHNPPVQNNVTKDIAVLSQLTPEIRLYGTDCNQTEMVLHAIDILDIASDFKVWLGVWQDGNETTNTRQLQQMYNVLDSTTRADSISGVVVGNEVLFSKYMTEDELINVISSVRSNLTSRGLQVPVATSDLGSNWSKSLAAAVDVVMANVHPFFGGVAAPDAAAWTWSFWQNEDVALTQGTSKKHVISEVGWPSAGGNDCGTGTKCADSTSGSVAGVDEMNQFMNDWVCQSLQNQTSYFWFETFDEPWKVRYNSPGEEWEDKWGLMDVNRNIKKGLKIPDCGGQTAGPTTWPAPMAST